MENQLSAYFRMEPDKREVMKAKARERYRTCGERQRRSQYLKALRVGLISKPGRALARHRIVRVDGEYRFVEDLDDPTEKLCVTKEATC